MISDLLTNPEYWADRAEEMRVLAERSAHAEINACWKPLSLTMRFWHGGRRNDHAEARQTTAISRRIMGIGFLSLW
jgi:hypothetical protein